MIIGMLLSLMMSRDDQEAYEWRYGRIKILDEIFRILRYVAWLSRILPHLFQQTAYVQSLPYTRTWCGLLKVVCKISAILPSSKLINTTIRRTCMFMLITARWAVLMALNGCGKKSVSPISLFGNFGRVTEIFGWFVNLDQQRSRKCAVNSMCCWQVLFVGWTWISLVSSWNIISVIFLQLVNLSQIIAAQSKLKLTF